MRVVGAYLDLCDRYMPGYSRPTDEDEDEYAPCERCEEVIATDVSTCPECDNSPYSSAKWSAVAMMGAGFLLSLTGIGAIVGIPLFLVGLLVRLGASSLSPTEYEF